MSQKLTEQTGTVALNLKDLRIEVIPEQTGKKLEVRETEGVAERKFADIVIVPERGLAEVRLYAGASTDDLETARTLIAQISEDSRIPDFFFEGVWPDGTQYWVSTGFLWDRRGFAHVYELRPCLDPDCVVRFHEWLRGEPNESCRTGVVRGNGYAVHGARAPGETSWVAWADATDLPDGHEGLKAIKNLAKDFAAMQAKCDRISAGGSREVTS